MSGVPLWIEDIHTETFPRKRAPHVSVMSLNEQDFDLLRPLPERHG